MVASVVTLVAGVAVTSGALVLLSLFGACVLFSSLYLCHCNMRDLTYCRHALGRAFANRDLAVEVSIRGEDRVGGRHQIRVEDELLGNGVFHSPTVDALVAAHSRTPGFLRLGAGVTTARTRGVTKLRRRGVYTSFRFRLWSDYPFGLFRQVSAGRLDTRVVVHPAPLWWRDLPQILRGAPGADAQHGFGPPEVMGEITGLRDFRTGDAVRLIHWPLSARYQTLVVKEFEPSAPDTVGIIYHAFTPPGRMAFRSRERMLRTMAGLFLQLDELAVPFDFCASFNDWQPVRVGADATGLDRALTSLAAATFRPENDLLPVQRALDRLQHGRPLVLVVSHTPRRCWQDRLVYPGPMLCLDGSGMGAGQHQAVWG